MYPYFYPILAEQVIKRYKKIPSGIYNIPFVPRIPTIPFVPSYIKK